MRTARRIAQLFFFFLFIFLFLQASFPYDGLLPSDLFLRITPLVGITTFLSTWTFEAKLALGFIFLLLTLALGRFFCGWICPLGTLLDFSDKVLIRKSKHRPEKSYRSLKFILLIALLVAALFSVQLVWFLDPLVILFRTLTVVLYPAFVFLLFGFFKAAFQLEALEEPIYVLFDVAQKTIMPMNPPPIVNGIPILIVFLSIFAMGWLSRRFWCRSLCPLGALFGLFSRFRLLKRKVDDSCTACGICANRCRMQAIESDFVTTHPVECIECGECVAECPSHSISYAFAFSAKQTKRPVDLSRRRLLLAGIAGLSSAAVLKNARAISTNPGTVIRPPGSITEDLFVQKCIRCQACVHMCASTGGCLQPSLFEAGVEGLWSPIVLPQFGYCEFNCTLCGEICPTGAIRVLTPEDKHQLKIGSAFFDKNACIPWRDNVNCLVCEEHCPLPDKAIKFDECSVQTMNGQIQSVKFPYVVQELCIGCGICEAKCPVAGRPGIYITAEKNQRINV